jgi:hypothetical protein
MNLLVMVKKPTAFLPLAMSLAAVALVLGHVAVFGVDREADEGTAAHIWQLLMAAQVPVIAFFAIKWLPKATKPALQVIVLQAAGIVAALVPVFVLGL